jgi:hypothetical protein
MFEGRIAPLGTNVRLIIWPAGTICVWFSVELVSPVAPTELNYCFKRRSFIYKSSLKESPSLFLNWSADACTVLFYPKIPVLVMVGWMWFEAIH